MSVKRWSLPMTRAKARFSAKASKASALGSILPAARWTTSPSRQHRRDPEEDHKDGNEIVRLLRALRSASQFVQVQRGYVVGLFEKNLRFDSPSAEEFNSLLRDRYNPELTLPDGAIEDFLAVGTFGSKEKEKAAVNLPTVRDWSFAERAQGYKFLRLVRLLGFVEIVLAAPVVPHDGIEQYCAHNRSCQFMILRTGRSIPFIDCYSLRSL